MRIHNLPVVAIIMSCLASMVADADVETVDVDKRAIVEANNLYAEAIVDADLDTLMTFYMDDAVLMPPNTAPIIGKAAIRASWADAFARFDSLEGASVLDEVIVFRGWAYGRGHWIGITADNETGEKIQERLSFSGMWQKDENGSWKIARDMYNESASP